MHNFKDQPNSFIIIPWTVVAYMDGKIVTFQKISNFILQHDHKSLPNQLALRQFIQLPPW